MNVRACCACVKGTSSAVRTVRGTYARRPGDDEEDVPESMYLVNVESAWPPGGYNRHKRTPPPSPDTSGYVNAHVFAGEHVGAAPSGVGGAGADAGSGSGVGGRRGLTAEIPRCYPNCHRLNNNDNDADATAAPRDPVEYRGTARREDVASTNTVGRGEDQGQWQVLNDEETARWLGKMAEATPGATAAGEYQLVNEQIAKVSFGGRLEGRPCNESNVIFATRNYCNSVLA